MNEGLNDLDLLELSKGALHSFERRLATIPENLQAPFHEEARHLETELLTVYRVVVLCTKREEALDRVAKWWETMVRVCDEYGHRLNQLVAAHPACGAEQYYDRVLELRGKCLRLQKMHS
jgi:sugar phosphate isomerase/epimerase